MLGLTEVTCDPFLRRVPTAVRCVQSYNIIQMFLVANLLTSTSTIPVLAGLWHSKLGLQVVTPFSVLMGCAQGVGAIFWWTALDIQTGETYGQVCHCSQCVSHGTM